jgi:fermentation-respiration switch protein FrsA (DUF1100 family)
MSIVMKKYSPLIALLLVLNNLGFAQQTGTIAGIWLGALKLPASELRLAFTLVVSDEGGFSATMRSIDQGNQEIPMDEAVLRGDTLTVRHSSLGITVQGPIDPTSNVWSTTFQQGSALLPLSMHRVDKLPDLSRPQEPVPPIPYRIEEVTVGNPAAGITLAGTLTLPEGKGPFPAVVLLTGSGPQNRDEELFGHKPFLVLADHLTRSGIAVLRFDDRGVGGSTGSFSEANTADFAGDALAGVNFLESRTEIDKKRTGLIGHSEGGMVAPLAAAGSGKVDFIILLAAPGIPFGEIVLSQKIRQWQKLGMNQEFIDLNTAWHRQVFGLIASQKSDPQVNHEMEAMYEKLTPEEREAMHKNRTGLETEMDLFSQPWWRFAARYDAASTLEKVSCPVLALNGDKDTQVSARENLAAIEAALSERPGRTYTVKELAGLNHLFQTAETGDELEYTRIEETFSPVAMELIARWILGLPR